MLLERLMILIRPVGKRINANTSSRHEITRYLDVLGIHQLAQIIHDDIDTILMKIAVIAEGEKVEFERLALHHSLARNITDVDVSKIRLTGFRAKRSKLGAIECDEILVFRMFVWECFQHAGL